MTTMRPAAEAAGRIGYGEVFTRRWVVELMLDLADYRVDRDLTRLGVVEPSIGSGAFIGPLLERLLASRARHWPQLDWGDLAGCLHGWDLQPDHVEASRKLAIEILTSAGCPQHDAHDLAEGWLTAEDFLLVNKTTATADLVIGNPPYIRIEDLP
jgi:type I restriction-modification system DNA methylase subunit